MKTYIIDICYRMSDTYRVIAKDKLNAVKEITIRLINECNSDIDSIDIQNVKELIENDEL